MKDLAEVCPLSREVLLLFATSIRSITEQHSLFPLSFTRYLVGVPCGCLPRTEDSGLTVFCTGNRDGLGPLYPPVALGVHERAIKKASARHGAFWLKPLSIFGLFLVTTFNKRSPVLTIPLTLAPYPP